jgi:hydroxyacylglutathione hydrolase
MILRLFYDSALAQASYLLACELTREAIVIDPARDIAPYLAAAAHEQVKIVACAETHIHADFVSGSRELAQRTGAKIYASAMGGAQPEITYPDGLAVRDGDVIRMGDVQLSAMHTAGHSPEHLMYIVTDFRRGDQPLGIFSGDCLFVGDVGRADLHDPESYAESARQQFANIERLRSLPDHWLVFPGHGAGSACGKSLGDVPVSSLGYEKALNPAFQQRDLASFVEWLARDQVEIPSYFAHVKRINREGAPLIESLAEVLPLEGFILSEVLKAGGLVIDARPADQFATAHIHGTLNIPFTATFNTYAGWMIDDAQGVYLIAYAETVPELIRQLRAIGVDDVRGYFPPYEVEGYSESVPTITAEAALERIVTHGDLAILDVRSQNEYNEEHIRGAIHIFYGELPSRLHELPRDHTLMIHCASGYRSQIAASVLQRAGFTQIVNLHGGIDAWKGANQPTETA